MPRAVDWLMVAGSPSLRGSASRPWARRLGILSAALLLVLVAGYATRRSLLLNVARVFLERDSELVAQEKADGFQIVFAKPPPPWVAPLKNLMNPMWQSIGAEGVNYYTFAGPGNLLRSYSERSDPRSPYYQAWIGGFVTKRRDGTLPQNLPAWAKQVTELINAPGSLRWVIPHRSPNRRHLRAWEVSSSTAEPWSCGTARCAVTATSAKAGTVRWRCWLECGRKHPGRRRSTHFTT